MNPVFERYRAFNPCVGESVIVTKPSPFGGADREVSGVIDALHPELAEVEVRFGKGGSTEWFSVWRLRRPVGAVQPAVLAPERITAKQIEAVLLHPRRKRGVTVDEIAMALGFTPGDVSFLPACAAIRDLLHRMRRHGFRLSGQTRYE